MSLFQVVFIVMFVDLGFGILVKWLCKIALMFFLVLAEEEDERANGCVW